jgi:hypothetical protein
MEAVDPAPGDERTREVVKTEIGPDTFSLAIEGAERRLVDGSPTRYLGDCEYEWSISLNSAGLFWLSAELLFEVRFLSFLSSPFLSPAARTD